MLVVRAGAIALMITGMEKKKAQFQALSAFTGTGFTTKESEEITSHPQRRKIVSVLIILGNAGFVATVASLVGTFATTRLRNIPVSLVIIIAGLYIIYKIGRSKGFITAWDRWIEHRLLKLTFFKEKKIMPLFELEDDFMIARVFIGKDSPLIKKRLTELPLKDYKIQILSIERKGKSINVPKGMHSIHAEDILLVYGSKKNISKIFL